MRIRGIGILGYRTSKLRASTAEVLGLALNVGLPLRIQKNPKY